jgi:WxL domain surface cell wall-binding
VAALTFHRLRASAPSPGCRPPAWALALVLLALAQPAAAWGAFTLEFVTAPKLPALPAVTLNAKAQTVTATMNSFSVSDTRFTKSGWNVSVNGQSGTGKSAVFARYCPKLKCGSDSEGYVTGGAKLAANSLQLSSTGAAFTGGTGSTPKLLCSASCNVDSATAVKVASAETSESTWTAGSWSATSLKLTTQTTLKVLANEEVYRANILWTLATGP